MKKVMQMIVLLVLLVQPGMSFTQTASARDADSLGLSFMAQVIPYRKLAVGWENDPHSSQLSWLYPQDLNPPESCHVPQKAPLGQDVEIMLGPWYGPNPLLSLDQAASWQMDATLPGATVSLNLEIVALNTEQLIAAWRGMDGKIYYATWGAGSGWSAHQPVGTESASGKPALISRGPVHWAVLARFNNTIKIAEWYNGSLGGWQELPGISDAGSDPVVVSKDAGHMAVFYRATNNMVKFTEWEGAWLSQPISLGSPPLPIAPDLSAISRSDNHLAVFGVDSGNQLWFRERLTRNELDWSDTAWVKLMDGVEIAKPAVASRHANHIGVVVKDTTGRAYYTRWTSGDLDLGQGGQQILAWSAPTPLGDAIFASPMTLVARSLDSLAVLGVKSDNTLYEVTWTEDTGWGDWHALTTATMKTDKVVAAVVRRMHDVMLLGLYNVGDQAWYKHYSSLDQAVTDDEVSTPLEGHPRAQVLSIVDGRTLWVSLTRDDGSGKWRALAREISTGISASLDLNHADSGTATNRVAVAAADLDVDGSAEVVVATLQENPTNMDISILEVSFPNTTTLVITTSQQTSWEQIPAADDVNMAIGDLDGDGAQNEVVIGFNGVTSMRFGVFQYKILEALRVYLPLVVAPVEQLGMDVTNIPGTAAVTRSVAQGSSQFTFMGATDIPYHDWCPPGSDCSVSAHDLEIAIGRVVQENVPPLERQQLVILDVSRLTKGWDYAQDWVGVRHLITTTWALEPVAECNILDPNTNPGPESSTAADPYTGAMGTGDMEADGFEEVVYAFGDRIAVITDTVTCGFREMTGLPDRERSLVVGDIDIDGRSEVGIAYRDSASTDYSMIEMVENQALRVSAQYTANGSREILAGDMDNNTRVAELAGCKTFAEVHVVAVLNGAPRWYDAGQPIQDAGAQFGRTKESGGGSIEDGTTHRFGGSLSVGYEYEFNAPITAIKISEVRGGVTQEFMGSIGETRSSVYATTRAQGYQYEGSSLGMVVYNSTEFTCYYYDVYPPAEPESKTRAMLCTPTGRISAEDFKALEDWHSANFKQAAGPSWVDVGHRSPAGVLTNDLEEPNNYPSTLPVDPSRIKYTLDLDQDDPIMISYSSQGGFVNYWYIKDMEGGQTVNIRSFESNTTLSLGATLGGFKVDLTGTYGYRREWGSTLSWGEALEIGGSVEKYQDPNRLCYDIIPFVYTARAITAAGVVYPYLEMDYYLFSNPYPCSLAVDGSGIATDFILP